MEGVSEKVSVEEGSGIVTVEKGGRQVLVLRREEVGVLVLRGERGLECTVIAVSSESLQ